MLKLWHVARHEYTRNVFKRSFILALASVPLILGLNIGVGLVLESAENNDSPVGYVDHAGVFSAAIPVPVEGTEDPVEFTPYPTEAEARAALEAGQIQAYYVVAEDYARTKDVELFYLKEPGNNATRQFYDFIQVNLMADKPPDVAHRAALLGGSVTVRSLDGKRAIPSGGPPFAIIMPLAIGMAFLFLLLMSAGYLVQAVVDEKENRTMELLTTSLSPLQLIGGKVSGIVAIGLTQLTVWAIIAVAAIVIANRLGVGWVQDLSLDWGPVLSTVVIAVPAFVVAASLMVAVGATTVSSQESQSAGAVFAVLHLVPLWLAWLIIQTPNAALPVAMSFFPFTALLTVTLRNIFASVPLWQVVLSASLQVLYAMGAVWLASRVFRLGMLRYGRRLDLREILAVAKS